MTRLIDLLQDAMPVEIWLDLASQLEQEAASKNAIDRKYHAAKVCAILNAEVQL